jgi:hypothetical protein
VGNGVGYEWMIFENRAQGFIEQHEVRTSAMVYNNTTIARVETMIEMYHTLLK